MTPPSWPKVLIYTLPLPFLKLQARMHEKCSPEAHDCNTSPGQGQHAPGTPPPAVEHLKLILCLGAPIMMSEKIHFLTTLYTPSHPKRCLGSLTVTLKTPSVWNNNALSRPDGHYIVHVYNYCTGLVPDPCGDHPLLNSNQDMLKQSCPSGND